MHAYQEEQSSPYTSRQLFDLVADIERYPEFLPWCRAARILERKEGECLAELVVSFAHMSESYVSRVVFTPPASEHAPAEIDVALVRGPFEYLTNHWRFTPTAGGGTQVALALDFKFRSRLLEKIMGPLFGKAANRMGTAFKERADKLYGQ